jgi:hypothetical protein
MPSDEKPGGARALAGLNFPQPTGFQAGWLAILPSQYSGQKKRGRE